MRMHAKASCYLHSCNCSDMLVGKDFGSRWEGGEEEKEEEDWGEMGVLESEEREHDAPDEEEEKLFVKKDGMAGDWGNGEEQDEWWQRWVGEREDWWEHEKTEMRHRQEFEKLAQPRWDVWWGVGGEGADAHSHTHAHTSAHADTYNAAAYHDLPDACFETSTLAPTRTHGSLNSASAARAQTRSHKGWSGKCYSVGRCKGGGSREIEVRVAGGNFGFGKKKTEESNGLDEQGAGEI